METKTPETPAPTPPPATATEAPIPAPAPQPMTPPQQISALFQMWSQSSQEKNYWFNQARNYEAALVAIVATTGSPPFQVAKTIAAKALPTPQLSELLASAKSVMMTDKVPVGKNDKKEVITEDNPMFLRRRIEALPPESKVRLMLQRLEKVWESL